MLFPFGNVYMSYWGLIVALGVGRVELVDLDLVVEVADVADDGLVLHRAHVLEVMMSLLPVVVT
jgi:hypothetical protein